MNRVFAVFLTIFVLQASAHAADKIRIGFPDLATLFMSFPLAQKRGFVRQEGLQAEFIRINPKVALTGLVTGEIDYYTPIGPAVVAAIHGLPLELVACYVPSAPLALIARPEFKSVRELRNKPMGINAFGGGLQITAKLIFEHFGLDPDKEVTFLAVGPIETRFAAMKQGITAATNGDGNIPEDGLRLVIEQAKKTARVGREVSISEVADLSILKEAQKELGIRGK